MGKEMEPVFEPRQSKPRVQILNHYVTIVIESKKVKSQGTHFMPQVGADVIRNHKQTCKV